MLQTLGEYDIYLLKRKVILLRLLMCYDSLHMVEYDSVPLPPRMLMQHDLCVCVCASGVSHLGDVLPAVESLKPTAQ